MFAALTRPSRVFFRRPAPPRRICSTGSACVVPSSKLQMRIVVRIDWLHPDPSELRLFVSSRSNTSQKLPHLRERVRFARHIPGPGTKCSFALNRRASSISTELVLPALPPEHRHSRCGPRFGPSQTNINSQENNRDKNQSRDGKAIGNSFSHELPGANILKDFRILHLMG